MSVDLRRIVYKTLSDEKTYTAGDSSSIRVCSFESDSPFALEVFFDICLNPSKRYKFSLEVTSDNKYFVKGINFDATLDPGFYFITDSGSLYLKTTTSSFTSIKARKEIKYGYITDPVIESATVNGTWISISSSSATREENFVKNLKITDKLTVGSLDLLGESGFAETVTFTKAVAGVYNSVFGNATGAIKVLGGILQQGDYTNYLRGATTIYGATTLANTLAVNGSSLSTTSEAFTLLNTPTTVNFASAGKSIIIGAIDAGNVSIRNISDSISASSGALTIAGGVGIAKKLYVGGNTSITGTLGVSGLATVGSLTSNGAIQINNTLTVAAFATTLGGTLTVTEATQLNNTLGVTGVASFTNLVDGTSTTGAIKVTGGIGQSGAYKNYFAGATTIANATGSTSKTTGALIVTGGVGINEKLYIGSTLNVAGASTLAALSATTGSFSSTLGVTGISTLTGLLNANGGIAVATNKFTVSALGAVYNDSTLHSKGTFTVNTNKFSVDATTGNTLVAGTLGVTGASTLAALSATTGSFSSTLGVTGLITFYAGLNGDNFTVADTTGNTGIGGTLRVDGLTTLTTGGLQSSVANSSGAVGFTLNTPSYTTIGAKLMSVRNNSTEKFSIDKDGNVDIKGNLTVQGDNLTLNVGNMYIEDKEIELAKIDIPTDLNADGGGIRLKGTTDKTISWTNSDDKWHFNKGIVIDEASTFVSDLVLENVNINQAFTINGGDVITTGTLTAGNSIIDGLTVTGATLINGTLTVGSIGTPKDVTLTGTLESAETVIDGLLAITGDFNVTGSFNLENAGGTTFDINTTLLTNGVFTSKAVDTVSSTTGFIFNMETELTNDDSNVLVVNNGATNILTAKKDGLISFDHFEINSNYDVSDYIRTGWNETTGNQILRVPELVIDGGTLIEGTTEFAKVVAKVSIASDVALEVIGAETTALTIDGLGNLSTKGKFIYTDGIDVSEFTFDTSTNRWGINTNSGGNAELILAGDTIVGGTY